MYDDNQILPSHNTEQYVTCLNLHVTTCFVKRIGVLLILVFGSFHADLGPYVSDSEYNFYIHSPATLLGTFW